MQVAFSAREAIRYANRKYFDLVILDAALNDMSMVQFTHDLTGLQPALKILLYPPENNPQHLSILGVNVNGYLRKPFFAPELSHYLRDLLRPEYGLQSLISEPETEPANVWLQNPDQLKILLEDLLSQTSAYSCLMCVKGQAILDVGEISPQVTQNVTAFLNHYWANYENQEIFRYMRMDADTNVVLLYSLPIHGGASLTLLYPPAIQIKQVRTEIHRLRDAYLKQRMNMQEYTAAVDPSFTAEQRIVRAGTHPEIVENLNNDEDILSLSDILGENEVRNLNQLLENMPVPDPDVEISGGPQNNWLPVENVQEAETQTTLLASMLFAPAEKDRAENTARMEEPESSPAADQVLPPAAGIPLDLQEVHPELSEPTHQADESSLDQAAPVEIQQGEPSPAVEEPDQVVAPEESEPARLSQSFSESLEAAMSAEPEPEPVLQAPPEEKIAPAAEDQPTDQSGSADSIPPLDVSSASVEETAEPMPNEAASAEQEPSIQDLIESAVAFPWDEEPQTESGETSEPTNVSSGDTQPVLIQQPAAEADSLPMQVFRITYSCLIVPRDAHVFLVRDLAERLAYLLPHIHLSHGWKLTSLTIRPQYLLWTVSLLPEETPSDVVTAVKNQTESHIHSNFPQYDGKNSPDNFWAEGYLAISGEVAPSRSLILDFQSRSRQTAN